VREERRAARSGSRGVSINEAFEAGFEEVRRFALFFVSDGEEGDT
jgi:hypothetical protein